MIANKCIFTLNHLGNYHMKNYYVMGYKPEKNMIQSIVSVAYFVKDLAHCKNYEDYPFYRKSDIKSFKSMFMVTKDFKKYTFDILSDNPNRYVVSVKFLNLLHQFQIPIHHIIPLVVVEHRNHDLRLENQFFYIEIEILSIENTIDLVKSKFTYDEYNSIEDVLILKPNENLEVDFFIIDEIGIKNQTPICSEEFKIACENEKIRGTKFFEIAHTPWLKGDSLDNYFAELRGETNVETLKTL